LLATGLTLVLAGHSSHAENSTAGQLITGVVNDQQGQPIDGTQVSVTTPGGTEPIAQAMIQADGRYALSLPGQIPNTLVVHIERTCFESKSITLDAAAIRKLQEERRSSCLTNRCHARLVLLSGWRQSSL
jgi:hypothetical protein